MGRIVRTITRTRKSGRAPGPTRRAAPPKRPWDAPCPNRRARIGHDADVARPSRPPDPSRARRRIAAGAVAVTTAAFTMVLVAQLALMSILDTARADRAATDVAASRFTTDLIDRTVRTAVGGFVDPTITDRLAAAATSDPDVRAVVRSSLITSHRQLVDPDDPIAAAADRGADARVDAVIADVLERVGTESGVDLSTLAPRLATSEVAPAELPAVGLGPIATRTRRWAGLVALVAATTALAIAPSRGRTTASIGRNVTVIAGVWTIALFGVGRLLDLLGTTLLGEVLVAVWSNAVPAMAALTIAVTVLGVGTWFAGIAWRGLGEGPPARRGVR